MKFILSLITFFKSGKNNEPVKNYDTFLGLDLDTFLTETGNSRPCTTQFRL